MLAEIAPSVAGWPAAKPKVAHATSATVITQTPTLAPLTICCPTKSLDRFGGRGQWGVKGHAAVQSVVVACLSASTAPAAIALRPGPP
jgi:hypothetical protein